MSPQSSPKTRPKKPATRVGGSIPSRATSSQTRGASGKPGKTDAESEVWSRRLLLAPVVHEMRRTGVGRLVIDIKAEANSSGMKGPALFEITPMPEEVFGGRPTIAEEERIKLDAEAAQSRQKLAEMGFKPVFEVGAPYIINHTDAPDVNRIVICTHPDGRCRYLCIRNNRRWPHVMQLTERSTSLAEFGVAITMPSVDVLMLEEVDESQAIYADGRRRRWQDTSKSRLPMHPNEPKYWRMDDRYTLPLLIKWVEKYPTAQAQFERILRPWTCDSCQTSTVEGAA